MNLRDTLGRVLLEAVEDLPPSALGLRTHAIPTDESVLAALVSAAGTAARQSRRPVKVVIGSDARTPDELPIDVVVLTPHDAATTATRIRSDIQHVAAGGVLVYINMASTPGEAGLDGLRLLTGADLAGRFAGHHANLGLLQAIAASRSRPLRERLDEATLTSLVKYAEVSGRLSEQHALPILSLLPRDLIDEKPSARWVSDFDGLVGHQIAGRIRRGVTCARQLRSPQGERTVEWLALQSLALGDRPLEQVRTLGTAAARFAEAEADDPAVLVGLSRGLLRWLEKGAPAPEGPVEPADDDESTVDDGGEHGDGGGTLPLLAEWQLLQRHGLDRLRRALLRRDDERRIVVSLEGTPVAVVRPSNAWRKLAAVLSDAGMADVVRRGGVLYQRPRPGADLQTVRVADVQEAELLPTQSGETGVLVDQFHEARAALLADAAVMARLSGESEEEGEATTAESHVAPEWLDGLRSLIEYPLLCAMHCEETHQAYVQAFEELTSHVVNSDDGAPLQRPLLRLDLAVSTTHDGTVLAVRILPAHPLRVLRHLLWLEAHTEPPALPEVLTLSPRDVLHPAALDVYLPLGESQPAPQDVAQAAALAAKDLWILLSDAELQSAVRIRIRGVAEPGLAVDALVKQLVRLFDDDVNAGPVHVEVLLERMPLEDDLNERTIEALRCEPGAGVSLDLVEHQDTTGDWVHAEVRGVPWGFRAADRIRTALPPGLRVQYQPGPEGHIQRIGIVDDTALDAWTTLQHRTTSVHPHAVLEPPTTPSLTTDRALLAVVVSPAGWPCAPEHLAQTPLLDYALPDFGSIVSVVNPGLELVLRERLSDSLVLEDARRAMLLSSGLRHLIARHLQRAGESSLHRDRGKARALREAIRTHTLPRLALSLDTPDALRWATSGGDLASGTRADLIVLDLTPTSDDVQRLRVVEVKALAELPTDAHLQQLSRQARMTAARVRDVFERGHDEQTEAFRRMAWLGAGFQRLAYRYRAALRRLDERLTDGDCPEVVVEFWVVVDYPVGQSRRVLPAPELDACGNETGADEPLQVRVLGALGGEASTPTGQGGPPADGADGADGADAADAEPKPAVAGSSSETASEREPGLDVKEPQSTGLARPTQTDSPTNDVIEWGPYEVHPVKEHARAPAEDTLLHTGAGVCFPVGRLPSGTPVHYHPSNSRLNHLNIGIVGDMGTGKTQLTKYLIARMVHAHSSNRGHRPRFLIFDYKRDYSKTDFVAAVDATVVEPERIPLNILRLPPSAGASRRGRVLRAAFLVDTIKRVFSGVGHVQQKRLKDALLAAYDSHTEPMLHDVLAEYVAKADRPDSVQSILEQLVDLEVFTSEASEVLTFDRFLHGAVTVRLDRLAGLQGVQNLLVAFMLNMFYEWMLTVEKRPVVGEDPPLRFVEAMLLVDEADNIMQYEFPVLQQILQQGREFGVGVVLASQYLSHFYRRTQYDYREPLLSWFIHRVPNATPRDLQGLGLEDTGRVVDRVKALKLHDYLCVTLGYGGDLAYGMPFWRYRLDCWRDQHPGAYEDLRAESVSEADLRAKLDVSIAENPPDLARPPRGYRS